MSTNNPVYMNKIVAGNGFAWQTHAGFVPGGTSPDEPDRPDFFALVAPSLREFDIIEIVERAHLWSQVRRVVRKEGNNVWTVLLSEWRAPEVADKEMSRLGLSVKWSASDRWCLVAEGSDLPVKKDIETREAAIEALNALTGSRTYTKKAAA